jgi:PAS domain S-box-containing protein
MPKSSKIRIDSGTIPEQRLQDIFNNAPIGVFISTPEGRYVAANPALARMFGYDGPEDLIASITDIATQVYADPKDREAFMRLMTEHGKAVEFECRFKRRDGTEFWVSRNVGAIRDDEGRVVAYQGFGTDITERKQAEEALRGSEERYRNVAEANAGIVWDMDANLTVTHVSGRVYEILGYEPEEIIGRNPIFLIDPEDRQRVEAIMARMLRRQEPVKDIEYWCRHSDGRRVRILTNGIAFFAPDGGFLGFRGTHIDITETCWARRCQKITLRLHEMINDDDHAISAAVCEACSEVTDSPMAFFGMVEPDESAMNAHVWSPAAMAECGIADKPSRFPMETAGLWAEPIRRREPVVCNDYPDAPEKRGLPDGHVPIARYLGVPILHGGRVVAVAGAANRATGYEARHIDRLRMITSTIADILVLRRKEEALREKSSFLQNIIDTTSDLLAVADMEGHFKFVGPSHSILGYDLDSLVGRNVMDFVHPEDYRETAAVFADFLANREDGGKAEYRYRRANGDYLWFETIGKFILDDAGNPKEILFSTRNITARKQAEGQLKRIEWMLSRKAISNLEARTAPHDQGYGDLSALNRDGVILKSVGHERLKSFANEYMELLDTSSAIYEANGDYAFGIFASGWCRIMDKASRNLCDTSDNAEALNSGRWLCHESCWTDCSQKAIAKGAPVDIACNGGIRLYAAPIFAGGKAIGAINFGYGDPPKDPEKLKALADAYHLDPGDLLREAAAYDSRPPYIIEMAKNRLNGAAKLIGSMVETRQAMEALRESEARFKALHNASFGGITIHDQGVILECNQGLAEITGFGHDELIGMDGLLLIAEKSREAVMNNIRSGHEKPYEAFGLRKNGEEYPLRLEGRNIPYKGKRVRVVEFRDITEQKRAEEEREKLQEQLTQAQKMESVGRLAGGVAHDFNNMLGVILGHAEMALDQMDPSRPIFSDLEEIRKAADRSAILTRQLLTFARKQTIAPKVIDLNETVEGMLKMLRRLIGEDIDLAWLPGGNLAPVKMDPSQIDQILANLCVNARDAIAGVGKITIETGTAAFDEAYCAAHAGFIPGEYVMLAVGDNGCGMDKETVGHLFEPFFTTKAVGKGTGLGLATVYGAVKQNNGFVNVYSEPARGTIFKIYLPRHQAGTRVRADAATTKPAACGSGTILLVEDEPAILRMATTMLERLGYTVIAAQTPGEAIRLAHEHSGSIDLLMTDVVMPEMNGRDLAKNLLSIHPDIKRLFMSGYTANVIAHHGVLDEGVHFIQKPFSSKDLGAKLRHVLEE